MSVSEIFQLRGRVAVVTGASRNIGKATARLLAEAGADLVITARDAVRLEAVANEIGQATDRSVQAIAADLITPAGRRTFAESALNSVGHVDILVNNAYQGPPAVEPLAILSTPDHIWQENLQMNLLGPLDLIKAFGPGMLERGRGAIVNMVSGAAFTPTFGSGPYGTVKAALAQLTKCLAQELAPMVRVNAVCPGTTSESGEMVWQGHERLMHLVPMGRVGAAGELAPTVLYLVSDASSYTTGQVIFADGGRTQVGTAGRVNREMR
jgi:NAD(P)-dependent dehydrogenase (short-subunit alcohol dehydrogenase family)